jgi:glycosyltransferase involved in cell wall biosynthesis
MRVAVDVTPLAGPRSGVGHFTAELLDALATHEPTIDVVPFVVSARAAGSRTARTPLPSKTRFVPLPAGLAHRLWAVADRPRFDGVLLHPDVVHGTNFVAPPTRAPRVISLHDLTFVQHPDWCRPEVRAMAPPVRRAVRAGAWVHTLTDAVAEQVRSLFDTDRVVTVHPAGARLPAGDVHSPRVASVIDGPPYVLALGAAEVRKNLGAVVALFAGSRDAQLRLVVAGPNGPESARLAAAAARTSTVVLVGYVTDEERAALLRHARALVHPAFDEGFGIPVVEAMEVGVPVVCTDTAVLREVAGDAARYVDASWKDALDVVAAVAADGAEREQLVAAGFERARRYTWKATARGMAALYQRAAAAS